MIHGNLADRLRIQISDGKPNNKISVTERITSSNVPKLDANTQTQLNNMGQGISTALEHSDILRSVAIMDGSFGNPIMGTGSYDGTLNAGQFQLNLITLNRQECLSTYHSSWIFRRVIDKMSQDMWSKGIDVQGEVKPEDLTRVYKKLNKLKEPCIYATQQGRLYGGAASLIMVDDGEEDLTKPLNISNIRKGSKIRLETTDRWWGLSPSPEVVTNFRNVDYGTPKYYTFDFYSTGLTQHNIGVKAHHSRVIRWVNRKSSKMLESMLMGWGLSELEHIYQDLLAHETTKNAINSLLDKSLLEIVKVRGMRSLMSGLAGGNAEQQVRLTGTLSGLNTYRTVNSLVLLDTEDDYNRYEYGFSGLSEILEVQKDTIAGAAEMPKVLLYGDTKGGLSSDSPAELTFYAQTILGKQEQMCRPAIDKLLPIIFASEGIQIPKNLDYEFVSLIEPTQDQKSSLLSNTISSVNSLVDMGIMTRETALEEIQQIQKKTDFGTNITDRDKEKAKKTDEAEEESPDGMELDNMNEPNMEEEEELVDSDYKSLEPQVITKNIRLIDKIFKRNK